MKETYLETFRWTYYWNVFERDYSDDDTLPLYNHRDGSVIAHAKRSFVEAVKIEGTGVLADGTMVNLVDSCSADDHCFFEVDTEKYPSGVGSQGNALHPWRSVAADQRVLPFGARIYIEELDGLCLPPTDRFDPEDEGFNWDEGCRGYRHDGCVVVDDVGGSIRDNHLDFFALTSSLFQKIGTRMNWAESVNVYLNSPKCHELQLASY